MLLRLLHWPTFQPLSLSFSVLTTCRCQMGCKLFSKCSLVLPFPPSECSLLPVGALFLKDQLKSHLVHEILPDHWELEVILQMLCCAPLISHGSFHLCAILHCIIVDVLYLDKGRDCCFCILVCFCVTVGVQHWRNEHSYDLSVTYLMCTVILEKSGSSLEPPELP